MSRYKIFEVEAATHLPGGVRILNDSRTIGEILADEISAAGGAKAFGVECPSFGWFLAVGYYRVLLHETDAHFNTDLAMKQLANQPGRAPIDFFAPLKGRMSQLSGFLLPELESQGMTPTAMGPGIPHEGMGGMLMRSKNPGDHPAFAAPPLPCLGNTTPAQAAVLVHSWFKQIQDILRELKDRHGPVDVAFMSGGNVPIPDWFWDWCAQEGITILIIEPPSNPDGTEMTTTSSPLVFASPPPSQAHADLRLIHSLAEGVEIRCGEDLIHLIATAENSGWVLTAESFLSKYWQSIWKDKNMPITGILHELSGAKETFNREMLYRLLLTIQQDSKHGSGVRVRSQLEALSVLVAREIATANECEPPDFSDFPPFMAAALPQPSEYIACSVAMECLCVMTGDDRESPWKMPSSPKLTSQSLEGIIKALRNQHCRPATPGSVDYCERVIRRIMFWQE